MTNPLIPNTFIPGTKAKAQEVNANFIALAEEIQGTQSNVKEEFAQLRAEIDKKMEHVAQNYAQKDLINSESITNTILEAPYGVATYDGQTITVQSEIKLLIPDGKTEDGKLKSLEYTTQETISKSITNLTDIETAAFLDNTGNIEVVPQKYIFYKNSTPSTIENNAHWYNTNENKWYKYILSESRWIQTHSIPIANVTWNENSIISVLKSSQPINLLKASDLNNFYTLKGILPTDIDYIVERYADSWDTYTIYKSGWVKQSGCIESKGDAIANFHIPMQIPYIANVERLSAANNTTDVAVWLRNDLETTYMKIYSGSNTTKLWSVEGFKLNSEEV